MSWTTGSLHLVYRYLSRLGQPADILPSGLSFGAIFGVAKSALCLDLRDKVYGLIGMMDLHISSQLLPNYSLPPSEAYAEVARAFI